MRQSKSPFELPQLQPAVSPPAATSDEPARPSSNPLLNDPSLIPSDELAKKRVSPFSQFSYDKTPSTNLTDPLLRGDPAKPWRPRRTLRDYRHLLVSAAQRCVYYGIHYIVILGAVVLLSLVLCGIEVASFLTSQRLENHRQLILATTGSQVTLSSICAANTVSSDTPVPLPEPPQFSEVIRRIKKLSAERQKRCAQFIQDAKDGMAAGECADVFDALSGLGSMLTVDMQTDDHPRLNGHARLFVSYAIGLSELRQEGPLNFLISPPVTSARALQVMGGNLYCSPVMHRLMLDYDAHMDDKMICVDGQPAYDILTNSPVNNPLHSTIAVDNMLYFIAEVWQQANDVHNPFVRNTGHFIEITLLFVTAVGSMLLLLRLSLRQHRARCRHTLIQQDFVLHNGKVAIRPQTLCALDYYCWKAGSMEAVEVQEVMRYGANHGEAGAPYAIEAASYESYAASDSFTGQGRSPEKVPTIPTSPETKPSPNERALAPQGGSGSGDGGQEKGKAAKSVVQMAQSLVSEARARRRRLRAFVREGRQLHGLTQMELYMHRIVPPLLLLRPFLPGAMMQRFLYDPRNDAGLGPSLSELATCSVLQDGLEQDHAVYVFVSFRKYNTCEALGLATKHFVQLDAERQEREDLARAEEDKRAFLPCRRRRGRSAAAGGKHTGAYSRLAADVDEEGDGAAANSAGQLPTRPLGARLLGDDGFDFVAEAEAAAQREQQQQQEQQALNPLKSSKRAHGSGGSSGHGSAAVGGNGEDALRGASATTSVPVEASHTAASEVRSGGSANPLSQPGHGAHRGELTHPLSPLAVGLCYVLTYARHASDRFHGELVQVSSDGILIQFRNGPPRREREHYCPHVKDTIEQLGLTSADDDADEDDNNDKSEFHGGVGGHMRQANMSGDSYDRLCSNSELAYTSGDIEVNGRRIYMSAEERAVRTAYSIQRSLDHCLDFEDNRYIPLDLLQCPIIVLSDRTSLRGRVGFHVTRHYTVLSQCIPVLFPLEQLCLEYNAGLIMTEDVYECVEGSTVARPFHFLAVADLNCYRFDMQQNESFEAKWRMAEHHGRHGNLALSLAHGSGNTEGTIGDGMLKEGRSLGSDALTQARRRQDEASSNNSSISNNSPGGAAGVDGTSSTSSSNNNNNNNNGSVVETGMAARDVLNANRDVSTAIRSFSATGSVYEVLNVRSVGSNFESEETSGEHRSRNQVRHTHWKLIWDKYVQMIGYRGNMRTLTAYARAFNHGKAKKSLEQQQQDAAMESEGLDTELDARPSYLTNAEDVSSSSLFSMSSSQSETLHVKELFTLVCDELHDCYHELLAYKRVYGVRKHEEYSFQRVEQEVLAMLKALGEVADDGNQENESKF